MENAVVLFDLYLIRHGQSEGNAGIDGGNSVASRQDPLLSPLGHIQAQRLGERFADLPVDAVLSSGLRRALQTAQHVVACQPEGGAKSIEILPLLTECNTREGYTGFSFAQLRELVPCSRPAAFRADTQTVLPNDDGKHPEYNIARAREVMDYLFARFHNGERVMIVAHGIFNTVLLMQALGIEVQRFDPDFDNAGITLLSFFKQGTGPWGFDVRLRMLNDASHCGDARTTDGTGEEAK